MMELTILMPCLNEERTIAACIYEAQTFLDAMDFSSEILIVDNGSTDSSISIAESLGARVITCNEAGYGNALRCGFKSALGEYIIYADCDMSYNLFDSAIIYKTLKNGADLVIGNRFHPFPSKEAMSFSHRLGVPFLSILGKIRYHVNVRDFHCGIRGLKTDTVGTLPFTSEGMEFATEIIARTKKNGLCISQVPVTLRPDGRGAHSHLRTISDGFRHLWFMLKPL